MSLTKNPKPKTKIFFSLRTRRLAESWGIEQLFSTFGARVMLRKARANSLIYMWTAWIILAAKVLMK